MVKLQTMEAELIKCPQLRLEDVTSLREWARAQPHFPNLDDVPDLYFSLFLRRRYYDLELAKQTLDNCLTFRANAPELTLERSLTRPEIQRTIESQYLWVLDELDPEENVVVFHHFHKSDASKYDVAALLKRCTMLGDAWLLENGSANGITYVFDQANYSLAHLLRVSITALKKAHYFNKECAPMSLKGIYIINANAITQKILALFRPFIEDQLFKKMKVFTSSQIEEFYKYVPKKIVPKDYGGDAGTILEFHEKSMQLIKRNEEFFEKTEKLITDESKRTKPLKKSSSVFKLKGVFKRLEVD